MANRAVGMDAVLRLVAGMTAMVSLVAGTAGFAPGTALALSHRTGKAVPRTRAFADSRLVPTTPNLQKYLTSAHNSLCTPGKPVKGTVSFSTAIADARKVVNAAGAGAVKKVETGRDKNPQQAEIDAAGAMAAGNPVGALAALLSAYDHDKANPTHLRNMGAVMAQISKPLDALAILKQAAASKVRPRTPAGISEADSTLTNEGFAYIEMRRYAKAEKVFGQAVAHQPLLSEAKLDLGMAEACGSAAVSLKAAATVAAGERRNSYPKTDVTGVPIIAVTQAPVNRFLDTSDGKSGTLPYLDYPKSVDEVQRDGSRYASLTTPMGQGTDLQYFTAQEDADFAAMSKLETQAHLTSMPPVTQNRIHDLEAAMSNAEMGGYQGLMNQVVDANGRASAWTTTVFDGQCGLACTKMADIVSANGGDENQCTVEWPEMKSWLTAQTKKFAADMQAVDIRWRKEWAAQSKWATGVIANISNPKIARALSYELDALKQSDMWNLAFSIDNWEAGVHLYDFGVAKCGEHYGAGVKPPANKVLFADHCPSSLKDHGFSFSVGVVEIAANCESISITAEEEVLGPFARVSVTRNGAVTVTLGAKAGVSMGPMSVGVEAGVYVTVDGTGVTDAGVTANAGASAKGGSVSMDLGSAGYTGSFTDVANGLESYVK